MEDSQRQGYEVVEEERVKLVSQTKNETIEEREEIEKLTMAYTNIDGLISKVLELTDYLII